MENVMYKEGQKDEKCELKPEELEKLKFNKNSYLGLYWKLNISDYE